MPFIETADYRQYRAKEMLSCRGETERYLFNLRYACSTESQKEATVEWKASTYQSYTISLRKTKFSSNN